MAKNKTESAVIEAKDEAKPTLRRINFYIDALPGCCGVGVIYNIKEEDEYKYTGHYGDGRRVRAKRRYFTKEEQAQACYDRLVKVLENEDNFDHQYGSAGYNTYLITLVSNYAEKGTDDQGQFPELQDVLLANGWQINQVVVNPNHGNEITLFSKHDPKWGDAEEEDEDEDEEEEDDDE
jgi:hypothetical protein